MERKIRTNEIELSNVNYAKMDEDFVFFKVTTSEKYIDRRSFLLDMKDKNLNILSIAFESGKTLYLMMVNPDTFTEKELKQGLKQICDVEIQKDNTSEDAATKKSPLMYNKTSCKKIPEHMLLRLFLNALSGEGEDDEQNKKTALSNVTGKLYYITNWKNKENEKCLEIGVTKDMYLTLKTHRIIKVSKLSDKERMIQPQYEISDNQTMNRADIVKDSNYVIKGYRNRKTSIDFINYEDYASFRKSKMGALACILNRFKERFSDRYFSIGFREYSEEQKPDDFDKSVKDLKDLFTVPISNMVKNKGITLVDEIQDEASKNELMIIQKAFERQYGDETCIISEQLDQKRLNIRYLHEKEFYESQETISDPYQIDISEYVVQHLTRENIQDYLSDIKEKSENKEKETELNPILLAILKELVIKQDIKNGYFSIVEWGNFRASSKFCVFVYRDIYDSGEKDKDGKPIKNVDYYKMGIPPYQGYEKKMFTIDKVDPKGLDFSDYESIFTSSENDKAIFGIMMDGDNSNASKTVMVLKNTEMFTIPDLETIDKELRRMAENNSHSKEEILQILEEIKEYISNSEKWGRKQRTDIINKLDEICNGNNEKFNKMKDCGNTNKNIASLVSSRNVKTALNEYFHDEFGYYLYISRGEEYINDHFAGVANCNIFDKQKKTMKYCVGDAGKGINEKKFSKASRVREIELYKGKWDGEDAMLSFLELENVGFVRNGQMTVMPFPFKYLREYAEMQRKKTKQSTEN